MGELLVLNAHFFCVITTQKSNAVFVFVHKLLLLE